MTLPSNPEASRVADNYGLAIQSVTWEDCARWKGSSVGPNISDMTLQIAGNRLPVIRHPNFTDLTWDVPMESIPLVVGNEAGEPLYQINLKEYLEHLRMYLHNPDDWTGLNNSLYAPDRDSNVVMSAQACFLPVVKGAESIFNVCLYNYQSTEEHPAVLAIVATSNGTSAQIINGRDKQLFFNNNGLRASFVAQRLSDNRAERGVSEEGEMSAEERAQNLVMIIQVPLKVPEVYRRSSSEGKGKAGGGGGGGGMFGVKKKGCFERRSQAGVEDAIIKVGDNEGPYTEIGKKSIERDDRYPVRVTLQYYKSTDTAEVTDDVMFVIAEQLTRAREQGVAAGSLVLPGHSGRSTEWVPRPVQEVPVLNVPPWWDSWWLTYGSQFVEIGLTEDVAKEILFLGNKGGRFSHYTMSEAHPHLMRLLSGNEQSYAEAVKGWYNSIFTK
jgi:hypothetical protein